MFINKAWVTIENESSHIVTNNTFHQGAGVSLITFSHSIGGQIFNAQSQALDYKTTAKKGIFVAPDEDYEFDGWSHDAYFSLRGEIIPANSQIMHYDTLTVFGNVHLKANFVLKSRNDDTSNIKIPDEINETEDKVWAYNNELYIRTSKADNVISIYTPDGILHKVQHNVSAGETKIILPQGIYFVTLNYGVGKKIKIN